MNLSTSQQDFITEFVYQQRLIHKNAVEKGFYETKIEEGTALALIHSEVSEAMEGHRKNLMDDKLPTFKAITVELADACIRIFDLAGALGLDLGPALAAKMAYNVQREDHKLENRGKPGGKAY